MHEILLGALSLAVKKPYHNTYAGEIITGTVAVSMAITATWVYIRNFVQHKSTAADL